MATTAVVGYTLRACLPVRRRLGLLLLGGLALLFGVIARQHVAATDIERVVEMTSIGIFGLVVPLGCLVMGDAALGSEIRHGTFGFTWLSPVPISTIVLGRWLAATAVTCVVLVPAAALSAEIGGAPEVVGPVTLATAVAVAAYTAVFVAIGATFRRSTVVSLLFVFLVERLFGAVLSAVAQLSPSWLGRAALTGMVDGVPDRLVRDGVPEGWSAIVRLLVVTAVALALAVRGLRRLRLAGAAD
jgi:ABC-2 type transport system permease protein